MNYVQTARGALAASLPDCDGDLLDLYTLLARGRSGGTPATPCTSRWSRSTT